MSSLYKTLPLEHPNAQIRLLRVLPGQDDKFELTVHDLDPEHGRVPEYIAISYTWGDKEPAQPITLNGHVVQVRPHCWQALHQLRSHHNMVTVCVWIDSICIDQSDNEEKNSQVALMGTIYKQAKSVAACLGSPSDHVYEKSMRALHAHLSDAPRLSLAALKALGETHYFSRIWIKQEIILAAEITLYTSQHAFSWDDIEKIIAASRTISTTSKKPRDAYIDRVFNVSDDRAGRRRGVAGKSAPETEGQDEGRSSQGLPRPAIVEEMLRYEDSECEDPRDRIYALLSLLPDGDPARRLFRADYTLSPLGFIHQAARGLSELHGDSEFQPDVLCFIRKIIRWFDGDRTLMQDINGLVLNPLPTRPADSTMLKLSVKKKMIIREPRRHTSLLPTGKVTRSPRVIEAAYLSKNISISTNGELESQDNNHDFVADLNPCHGGEIQYKIVEEALCSPVPPVGWRESAYCQYYLVSDAVGVGDVLAVVGWNWSTSKPDSSESYAILRGEKGIEHAERLRFHCWALPLDLAIACWGSQVVSGTRFGGSRDTNVLAYRFFHPDGFQLPASATKFAFSLEYSREGRDLDGRAILGEPAPHPALGEARVQLPRGTSEITNRVIDDRLHIRYEYAVRFVLAELYDFQHLRLRSDADDRSSDAGSLPPEKRLHMRYCIYNLSCIALAVFSCPLRCLFNPWRPSIHKWTLRDWFIFPEEKKSEHQLSRQDFQQRFPRDLYGNYYYNWAE